MSRLTGIMLFACFRESSLHILISFFQIFFLNNNKLNNTNDCCSCFLLDRRGRRSTSVDFLDNVNSVLFNSACMAP